MVSNHFWKTVGDWIVDYMRFQLDCKFYSLFAIYKYTIFILLIQILIVSLVLSLKIAVYILSLLWPTWATYGTFYHP